MLLLFPALLAHFLRHAVLQVREVGVAGGVGCGEALGTRKPLLLSSCL
jgi:hypothetical protein